MKKRVKDMRDLQARLLAAQSKPIKLRIAASVVHHELTRVGRFTIRGPEYINALTRAAKALSQVADIYYVSDERKLLRIPEEDLVAGQFDDGGNLFRCASGRLYKSLTVRRVEVIEGIEVLKKAQASIDAAASLTGVPAAPEKHHEPEAE
jgi:hypothetical protein